MSTPKNRIILCKDCYEETQRLENSGVATDIDCKVVEGDEGKSPDEKRCNLTWTEGA